MLLIEIHAHEFRIIPFKKSSASFNLTIINYIKQNQDLKDLRIFLVIFSSFCSFDFIVYIHSFCVIWLQIAIHCWCVSEFIAARVQYFYRVCLCKDTWTIFFSSWIKIKMKILLFFSLLLGRCCWCCCCNLK